MFRAMLFTGTQVRQHDKFHRNLWLTKGPKQKERNVLVLWSLFENELLALQHGKVGLPIDGAMDFEVYDAFLKKTYKLTVVLGMVHADSVMRLTMGKFMGVASYRADPYSVFEGFQGPGGRGMYFGGYAAKVNVTGVTNEDGTACPVFADDQRLMLDKEKHAELVANTEAGIQTPRQTGRHGRGALERLPYFDAMRANAHPFGHCVLYGVVKRFLKLLLGKLSSNTHPGLVLPASVTAEMSRRAARIQPPHDVIRPYHDVVKYFGESFDGPNYHFPRFLM